ncbi:hypothetical protein KAU19_06855 [Candidatus Parcubacteria bacterium]|nr:hypothetical protein [Candidatus Parcubacteria bacterium]
MKNIIKLRIFLWLVLVGVVGWLLYMAVVPSGKISYTYDFTKDSYFIKKLTPEERVKPIVGGKQTIIGDPVYFALRTPRRFNKARLTLKYRHNKDTECPIGHSVSGCIPVIEAGILVDKTIWRYNLQPIENRIIDELAMAWNVINENGIMLLQREKKYNSINDFLNNISVKISENQWSEIALYNYNLKQEFLLADYAPINNAAETNIEGEIPESSLQYLSLRGPYQFYTYIKSEDFDFIFSFYDLNKNQDSDPIDLHLYYDNQLIDSKHLDDDGITDDSGALADERSVEFHLANLPEGVYKIELRVNDDIITKSITTKQQKMAFINKLWLADGGNNDINLYTDSKLINAQTVNPGSLQTIKIISSAPSAAAALGAINIDQTYKQFSATVSSSTTKLTLEKDDMILSGSGVFSFSRDSLINPNFKKVDSYLDIDNNGINYVLAKYDLPMEENATPNLPKGNSGGQGWKIAFAEFDLTKAYREDNKYSFLISIPGLRADDDMDDWIEIDEISIDLEGVGFLNKIKGMF